MYTRNIKTGLLRVIACGVCLCAANPATAASVIIRFDFDSDTGAFENGPASAASELGVTGWYAATGSVSDFAGVEGRAIAARNFAAGNALLFGITIAPGFKADLTGVAFDHVASATGPTQWSLHFNGLDALGGAIPGEFARIDEAIDLPGLSGMVQVSLHGAGAASNSGTYRVDNFLLLGSITAVPIAPAMLLFGSVAALLPFARRR